ncbi:hypothetical protein ACT3TS_10145 [Specibacter sp. AOP5-B1-6]|uniref:hypothetical protein n=1 Tax=Specibacter sp. AOP5-B1-6 TaxID=3457653 RepID=UPI00402B876D
MKKFWASIALATALVTAVSGCTIVDKEAPAPIAVDGTATEPAAMDYPEATADVDTRLVVTVLEGNGLGITTHQLFCSGSTAVSPTNLPDADAACAVVETSADLFKAEPRPTDDKKCTGTGNQVVADVFGESQGNHVRVSYLRDNLCNAKVWDSLTPLIGLG